MRPLSPWVRAGYYAVLILACVIATISVLAWMFQAGASSEASRPATEAAQEIPTILYRIGHLETSLLRLNDRTDIMLWLLLANLAAAVGSLFTYIVTNHRRTR